MNELEDTNIKKTKTNFSKRTRLSLTKTDIQAGVGAELLVLCQSMTEDGSLSEDEVNELKLWLDQNRSSDLPSIALLSTLVEHIIADGKVTKEEQKELYRAIERVLPIEVRQKAIAKRKAVEIIEKLNLRAEREVQKQRELGERELNMPIGEANFMVAGVHYEGRAEVIRKYVNYGDQVFLIRDRQNKYSKNAIEVRLKNGMQIGFMPEDDAIDLAPLFDKGCSHQASITKILTGGRAPIPVVQTFLYRTEAKVNNAILEVDVPEKQQHPFSSKEFVSDEEYEALERKASVSQRSGCLTLILLSALLLIAIIMILSF